MKHLNTFITEYIIKKKLDTPIDSENYYNYTPKSRKELINNIKELLLKDIYDLNCIDTSEIIDMTSLFDSGNYNKPLNNIDISNWNVSKVKHMQFMFDGYENFNCDLSNWDVSNVEDMLCMFKYCKNFEGKGLENWNVGKVTDMDSMFENCKKLDCDLSNWDVHNVISMKYMFQNCEKFKAEGLDKWNISKVRHMDFMFDNCMKLKKIPSWY